MPQESKESKGIWVGQGEASRVSLVPHWLGSCFLPSSNRSDQTNSADKSGAPYTERCQVDREEAQGKAKLRPGVFLGKTHLSHH